MSGEQEQARGKELMCFDCGMTRWKCLEGFDGECCGKCEHPAVEQEQVGGVDLARADYERACAEMDRLTSAVGGPGNSWRWSIPANPKRDSDLIFAAALAHIPALVDELEQLRADAADWRRVTERAWERVEAPVSHARAEVAPVEVRDSAGGSERVLADEDDE